MEQVESMTPLSTEQLAQIETALSWDGYCYHHSDQAQGIMRALLVEVRRLHTAASELRGQVTSLLEDFANGCVPVRGEAGKTTTPYWLAVNSERARNLAWVKLKCEELGISWPIAPIPYVGNLPSAPAPLAQPALGGGQQDVEDANSYEEKLWQKAFKAADKQPAQGTCVKARLFNGSKVLATCETAGGLLPPKWVCAEYDHKTYKFHQELPQVIEWRNLVGK